MLPSEYKQKFSSEQDLKKVEQDILRPFLVRNKTSVEVEDIILIGKFEFYVA